MPIVVCRICKNQISFPREASRIERVDQSTYFVCHKCLDEKCGIKRDGVKNTASKMEHQ